MLIIWWSYVGHTLIICWSYDMCCWSYFSGSCFGIFLLFTVWPPWIKQLLGWTSCDQGPRPKYLLPREKGSTMKWFNININYQWVQGGTDYDYPEYPIYERSDQVDYNGGLFEDYPSSVLQGSLQKGTQRAGLEDYQGYQKLGLGYQDQTTRRFLRRLGNLASKKEIEDEADVWNLHISANQNCGIYLQIYFHSAINSKFWNIMWISIPPKFGQSYLYLNTEVWNSESE